MEARDALRRAMAERTGTDERDWYLVLKARHALKVALGAIARVSGRSEVITTPFTCVTAIDPIIAAGLTPRYVDIAPDTLALDPNSLGSVDDACAVMLQHTFGIISKTADRALVDATHETGAYVVEDSAHCLARLARDASGVPLADVSVHSFGVEKMLPTVYFGAAIWVNPALDASVRDQLVRDLESLPEMDRRLERATRTYRNQIRTLLHLPSQLATPLRERWVRRGAFEPAVSDTERRGGLSHEPSLPSPWVSEQALSALSTLDTNEEGRRACVATYLGAWDDDTRKALKVPAALVDDMTQPYLRVPVFLDGADEAARAVELVARRGAYAQRWPYPLLIPGVLDPAPYRLDDRCCPISERFSEGVCALPTDIDSELAATLAADIATLVHT